MTKPQTSWNLNLIIPKSVIDDPKEYREGVQKAAKEFIDKWKDNTDYLQDAHTLEKALDDFDKFWTTYGGYGKEFYYRWLKKDLDLENPGAKSEYNKIYELVIKIENDLQFFILNLKKISIETQREMLKSTNLMKYKHFLEENFKFSKYTLSEPEERIMNLKSKTSSSNWTQMVSTLLSKQERKVLNEDGKLVNKNFTEIIELTSDKNKEVRDSSAKAFNKILEEFSDVAEHELNTILENKKINDEIRGFETPDQSRHLGDDIDTEIVESLRNSVSENFDIAKRFYEIKAKFLGVEKLKYHERNIEVGNIKEKYSFEKAYEIVHKTFKNLDQEFADIFEEMFKNGQVDVFPKKGKRNGAYCSYNHKNAPVYVLLNHTDTLNNVLTMAHEFGHAFHFVLSKKQTELNYSFPMCTAETASTFFEDFVLQTLLKDADQETKNALIMMKLNDDVSTIFRQIAAYNFEKELHESFRSKGYLGKEEIGKIFHKHMESYMGDFVELSAGSENWWVYWSHIRNYFYNYSYSFGGLISKSLQAKVKEDKNNIKFVKEFLSAGSSKTPKELFGEMNIDITKKSFWKEGLDEINETLKLVNY